MSFQMPTYQAPDFSKPAFTGAPCAKSAPSPRDGVAPENYHATSIYPEYFKLGGTWMLAGESRMDCVAVLEPGGGIATKEFRNIRGGDEVILGRTEDGSEGIYVHYDGFSKAGASDGSFAFRTGRSRETAFSKDYDSLYELLKYEREHGFIAWVLGPACSFDADARAAMSGLIENGFANVVMAGNALATHDLEAALLRTALGQDVYTQQPMPNGHYNHIDVINKVRGCGSIPQFIETYGVKDGIVNSCVRNEVPLVLAGSIRDDGPLPEVIGNVYDAQDRMRSYIRQATTVICLATQLHTIATGNMTPSFRVIDGQVRPVFLYCVDISEFVTNKLRDRGSLAVTSIVTNVQDFLVHLWRGTAK